MQPRGIQFTSWKVNYQEKTSEKRGKTLEVGQELKTRLRALVPDCQDHPRRLHVHERQFRVKPRVSMATTQNDPPNSEQNPSKFGAGPSESDQTPSENSEDFTMTFIHYKTS